MQIINADQLDWKPKCCAAFLKREQFMVTHVADQEALFLTNFCFHHDFKYLKLTNAYFVRPAEQTFAADAFAASGPFNPPGASKFATTAAS